MRFGLGRCILGIMDGVGRDGIGLMDDGVRRSLGMRLRETREKQTVMRNKQGERSDSDGNNLHVFSIQSS